MASNTTQVVTAPASKPPPPPGQGLPPRLPPNSGTPAPADVEEVGKEPNLAAFLDRVIKSGASDLHLTSGAPPVMRLHGSLTPIEGFRQLTPNDLKELIYAILTQKQRERFEENLELDVSYQLPGRARFRVNVYRQRDAMGTVMRLIPFEIKTVDDLGLPSAIKEFARLKRGMVLVTGVTGSGKSTTLAALVDLVNTERADHIMTVEDPIEFLTSTRSRSSTNGRSGPTRTASPPPSSTPCVRIPTSSSSGR